MATHHCLTVNPGSVRRYMLEQSDSAMLIFRFLTIEDIALNCFKVSTLWRDLSQLYLQQKWRLPCPLLSQHLSSDALRMEQAALLAKTFHKSPTELFTPVAWLPLPRAHSARVSISHLPGDTRMMLVRPAVDGNDQWQLDIVDCTERCTSGYFPKGRRRPVRWQWRRLHAMARRNDFFVDWSNDRYGIVSVTKEGECTLVWHSMLDNHSEETCRLRMRPGYALHADFRSSRGGKLVAVTPNHVFLPRSSMRSQTRSDAGTGTVDLPRSPDLRVSPCGAFLARVSDREVSVTRVSDGAITRYTVCASGYCVRDVCIDDTGVFGPTRAIVTVECKKRTKRALKLLPITLSDDQDGVEVSHRLDLTQESPHVLTLTLRSKEAVPRVRVDSLTGTFRMKVNSRQANKWISALMCIDVFVHEDDSDFKLPSGHIMGSYMTPLLRWHDDGLRPVLSPAVFLNNKGNVRNGIPMNYNRHGVVAIGCTRVAVLVSCPGIAEVRHPSVSF
ncbi:MAG: hypothetical protein MHM6MM_007001 [Cercozoa sp. M6MM]